MRIELKNIEENMLTLQTLIKSLQSYSLTTREVLMTKELPDEAKLNICYPFLSSVISTLSNAQKTLEDVLISGK